jgi:hypothetical protein
MTISVFGYGDFFSGTALRQMSGFESQVLPYGLCILVIVQFSELQSQYLCICVLHQQ